MNATRGMLSFTVARFARDELDLVYAKKTANQDGSYDVKPNVQRVRGFLTDLTDSDIQRLKEGGITINSGAFASFPFEMTEIPLEIRSAAMRYKPVRYSISQGVSIFTLERHAIGQAIVEQNA